LRNVVASIKELSRECKSEVRNQTVPFQMIFSHLLATPNFFHQDSARRHLNQTSVLQGRNRSIDGDVGLHAVDIEAEESSVLEEARHRDPPPRSPVRGPPGPPRERCVAGKERGLTSLVSGLIVTLVSDN
jgi:hypothetical protein